MKAWKKRMLAAGTGVALLGGGYALASIPFGAHVTIGCDVTHGVQTYVSDANRHLAVVQNGCTGPDIQARIKVRVDEAHGVLLYQLHRSISPGGGPVGPIRDIAVLGEYTGGPLPYSGA